MFILANEYGHYAHNRDGYLCVFADELDANLYARDNGLTGYESVATQYQSTNYNRNN